MSRRYAQGEVFYPFFLEPHAGITSVDMLVIRDDGFYLDFNDSTFKDSAWTTKEQALAEKTEGVWVLVAGWTLPSSDRTYRVVYKDSDSNVYGGSEIIVGLMASDVIDVLLNDAMPEQTAGKPSATPALRPAIGYMFMILRNKITVDSGFLKFHNDAGAVIFKKALSDNGTTYDEGEGEAP